MDEDFIVRDKLGRELSIPQKSAESRQKISRRKRVRAAYQNEKPVNVRRFNSSFNTVSDNGMNEEIPTSGEGWTLK